MGKFKDKNNKENIVEFMWILHQASQLKAAQLKAWRGSKRGAAQSVTQSITQSVAAQSISQSIPAQSVAAQSVAQRVAESVPAQSMACKAWRSSKRGVAQDQDRNALSHERNLMETWLVCATRTKTIWGKRLETTSSHSTGIHGKLDPV
jgi:hypothetical protein